MAAGQKKKRVAGPGLSLHAMKRYGEAVLALLEAEKLDGKHEQARAEGAGLPIINSSFTMLQTMFREGSWTHKIQCVS